MTDAPSTRPLLDKLGIKAHHTVVLLRITDGAFVESVKGRAERVTTRRTRNADVIVLGCHEPNDLARIATLKPDLARDGSLWVVRPKGPKATGPTESDTRRAGLDAGLVDVKVVSFSDTHSALKYVYRLRDR